MLTQRLQRVNEVLKSSFKKCHRWSRSILGECKMCRIGPSKQKKTRASGKRTYLIRSLVTQGTTTMPMNLIWTFQIPSMKLQLSKSNARCERCWRAITLGFSSISWSCWKILSIRRSIKKRCRCCLHLSNSSSTQRTLMKKQLKRLTLLIAKTLKMSYNKC